MPDFSLKREWGDEPQQPLHLLVCKLVDKCRLKCFPAIEKNFILKLVIMTCLTMALFMLICRIATCTTLEAL